MKMQRFDEYMRQCLYGPDGFYTSGRGRAGRRGDFITSPEVGPLFGAVVARWLDAQWDALGQPEPFRVLDLGAGPGTLQRSLDVAAPRCRVAWDVTSIDVAPGATSLEGSLDGTVVVSNELLDNLPFRMARRTAETVEEAHVESGQLTWEPANTAATTLDQLLAVDPPPLGNPFPLIDTARALVRRFLDRGVARALFFDYGVATTSMLARRGGWLRTYREHQRGHDPLREPGYWDITTDVPLDQLPTPIAVSAQADFLRAHGIDRLVEEGRAYWAEHASAPDLMALRMRSRISEADALLDPAGLGSWLVLEYGG